MKLRIPAEREPELRTMLAPRKCCRSISFNPLRDDIVLLGMLRSDDPAIGYTLRIFADEVDALGPKLGRRTMRRDLTRRAVKALLHGRHAHLGGRTIANRVKRLVEIASAYSAEELLTEPGIGHVTAVEIQLWLESRGRALRRDNPNQAGSESSSSL